jgi:hypothetical protein
VTVAALATASAALAAALATASAVPAAKAETAAAPTYLDSRCIGTPSGKGDAYRDYMLAVTAKTMQVRANEGNIAGWIFARSVITADGDCDFLQVNLHRGFPPARTSIDPYMIKAGLKTNRTEWYARLAELTDAVRRELWRGVDQVGAVARGNFIRIDYYKANSQKAAEWTRVQGSLWRPAYLAAVKEGTVLGWQLDRLFLPAGSGYPYGVRTITAFRDWDAVGRTPDGEAVARAFHKGRAPALLAQDAQVQELVRSELFEVVDVIRPVNALAVP